MKLHIDPEFRAALKGRDQFDDFLAIEGEIYRQLENRRTLCFTLSGQAYFVKAHFGIGWREILKNLLYLRLPVLGARNEVRAIRRLEELGIATLTLVAYGWRGINPARQESFSVTRHLGTTTTLEDLCRDWGTAAPDLRLKRGLINRVADIARTLHSNGVNHRDFYLCHFHVRANDPEGPIWLIDLHRAQLRTRTPKRWIVKDIGGLYFSAMDIGLTHRDLLRFVRAYSGTPLRQALLNKRRFWKAVKRRAVRTYRSLASSPRD